MSEQTDLSIFLIQAPWAWPFGWLSVSASTVLSIPLTELALSPFVTLRLQERRLVTMRDLRDALPLLLTGKFGVTRADVMRVSMAVGNRLKRAGIDVTQPPDLQWLDFSPKPRSDTSPAVSPSARSSSATALRVIGGRRRLTKAEKLQQVLDQHPALHALISLETLPPLFLTIPLEHLWLDEADVRRLRFGDIASLHELAGSPGVHRVLCAPRITVQVAVQVAHTAARISPL